jgi:hypothetical protein
MRTRDELVRHSDAVNADVVSQSPGPQPIPSPSSQELNLGHSKRHLDSQWFDWETLGAELASLPSVSSWGPGRMDVFARGRDDTLLHRCYDNNRWSEWASIGVL